MSWNIFLAVAIAVLTVMGAGLAGQLAATKPWHKWVFWGGGLLTVILVLCQAIANEKQSAKAEKDQDKLQSQVAELKDDLSKVQKKLNENPNASVGVWAIAPLYDAQEISDEAPVEFNIAFGVSANTAKNMRAVAFLQTENSPPDGKSDKAVWKKYKGKLSQGINDTGQDRVPGTYDWGTPSTKMTNAQAKGILRGTSTLYLLGLIQWNNPSGTDGHTDICMWLQKPAAKIVTRSNTPWHICTR